MPNVVALSQWVKTLNGYQRMCVRPLVENGIKRYRK